MTSVLSSYYPTVGDSWLAQTNRIFELATGSLPTNAVNDSISSFGGASYLLSYQQSNSTYSILNQQSEDIQVAILAMESAGKGLEMVKTRIGIMDGLAQVIQQNPDISDFQRSNINDQINYVLEEIYDLSQTQQFNEVSVLDGTLAEDGVYVEIVGDNGIDISTAFNSVDPEKLGLPRQGEAFVRPDNVQEFFQQLSNAETLVNNQLNDIVSYSKSLAESFEIVSDALYQSSLMDYSKFSAGIIGTVNSFSQTDNGLSLSMGNVVNTMRVDTYSYEKMMSLLAA